MPIAIQPYRKEHQTAVVEFNQRLLGGGASSDLVFPKYAEPRWLAKTEGATIFQEYFVALDNGIVRGAYALKYQDFLFPDGSVRRVGYYHHPLSEGIVNHSYAAVGAMLLKDAMGRSPLLYCLGMGGYDRPLPKMLVRLGWSHFAVPFYFYIVRPNRFLREIQALRTSPSRRVALDLAAATGIGYAGIQALQGWRKIKSAKPEAFAVEKTELFSDWAERLWIQGKTNCAFTAVRDSLSLRTLYPASDTSFTRLRVRRGDTDIGWAVVAERRKDEKYGALRVGSIVDCWAEPQDASSVIEAASTALADLGMDLIVTNQSHLMWIRALQAAGFGSSTSNFIFAAGKPLAALLQPFVENQARFHLNRADGDGLPRNF